MISINPNTAATAVPTIVLLLGICCCHLAGLMGAAGAADAMVLLPEIQIGLQLALA